MMKNITARMKMMRFTITSIDRKESLIPIASISALPRSSRAAVTNEYCQANEAMSIMVMPSMIQKIEMICLALAVLSLKSINRLLGENKKGRLLTSHRYNHLSLLPSGPGEVQQELVV